MGGMVVLGSLLAAALLARPVQAQDPITTLLGMINQARVSQGLPPYALNEALTRAAQRHAEDMATHNFVDHTGSDGSSAVSRILEAGYGVYTFGPVVGENIYGGVGGPDVPFTWWMNSSVHRANILHEKYREIGIGVAVGSNGWTYWTLTFGAQPNVLPVFINDGAGITDSPQVTLTLTEEKIAPQGDGLAIGQPSQMRASTQPDFPNAEWQPWAARTPFTLEPVAGPQTVYVQLMDPQGRTSLTWATITLTEE
ncbi:MAG: CAP domain-containing protein, partial [Chloroflexi bacterium]